MKMCAKHANEKLDTFVSLTKKKKIFSLLSRKGRMREKCNGREDKTSITPQRTEHRVGKWGYGWKLEADLTMTKK